MLSVIQNLSKKTQTIKAELQEDIQAVFDRDPAARNTLEVLLTYPGVHALLIHRVAHSMWQHNNKGLASQDIFSGLLCYRNGKTPLMPLQKCAMTHIKSQLN